MQAAVVGLMMMFSVLVPQKVWFAPNQPLNVTVKSDSDVTLVLTDFAGKDAGATPVDVAAGKTVDIKQIFPPAGKPGTYVLYAVKKGAAAQGAPADFLGTPLVIEVKDDKRPGAPPGVDVTRVEPLSYAVMTTDMGKITCAFYYDVAPHTVDNFLTLSEQGYYDGLVFHRIVADFVIQGGDPRGGDPQVAGSGGPGYDVQAEFNDRKHERGVLSMARSEDVDSAGSQFFICLNYKQTQQLDHKYTAFGQVIDGMDAVTKIAAVNVPDAQTGRPDSPPVIQKVEVLAVTAEHNPYAKLFNIAEKAPPAGK